MGTGTLNVKLGALQVRATDSKNAEFWCSCTRGSWEPWNPLVFDRFVNPALSYVDIGAWIGPTVLYCCNIASQTYALEPDPIAFAELSKNIELNRPMTNRVTLCELCIAPSSGRASFGSKGVGGDSMSSLLFASESTSWTVNALTFDDWLREFGVSKIGFIKVDIEGAEYAVIPTMLAYLKANRPTLYLSLHPRLGAGQSPLARIRNTVRLLRALSFYRHFYNPEGRIERRGVRLRDRIRHYLDRRTSKFIVGFATGVYAFRGRFSSLVVTDMEWT